MPVSRDRQGATTERDYQSATTRARLPERDYQRWQMSRCIRAFAAALAAVLVWQLGLAGSVPAGAAVLATVFVSPSGNDANAGTSRSQPVRTLGRAQQLVRGLNQNMTGDVRVELANGVYQLASPLTLTAADSGTGGHNVIWTAATGARPVISGGVPTTRARGAAPVTLTWTATGYTASGSAMASWRNIGDLEFVYTGGLGAWTEPRCSVGRIAASGTITMGQPCWNNSNQRIIKSDWAPPPRTANLVGPGRLGNPGPEPGGPGIPPTYVENAFELLDTPGEWYLDRGRGTVCYIPRTGVNLASARVVAGKLHTLSTGHGTPTAPVHHIVFNGLQLSYATWLRPSSDEGLSEIQPGYTIPGSNGFAVQGLCTLVPGGTCPYGAWTK